VIVEEVVLAAPDEPGGSAGDGAVGNAEGAMLSGMGMILFPARLPRRATSRVTGRPMDGRNGGNRPLPAGESHRRPRPRGARM
jgi:hypothetical protein